MIPMQYALRRRMLYQVDELYKYLYEPGNIHEGVTGGYAAGLSPSTTENYISTDAVFGSDYITMSCKIVPQQRESHYTSIVTGRSIHTERYSKIKFSFQNLSTFSAYQRYFRVYLCGDANEVVFSEEISVDSSTDAETTELNITSVNQPTYIGLMLYIPAALFYLNGTNEVLTKITNIWLEK